MADDAWREPAGAFAWQAISDYDATALRPGDHSIRSNPCLPHRIALATLILLLVTPWQSAAQATRAEQVERALGYVQAKNYDAALAIFQELARHNSRDYEARNWAARLNGWKGNYAEAEQLYRAVLAEQPGNLEAELGLADVIAWQRRHREALDLLRGLYEREPTLLEVVVRLGRFSRWAGEGKAALRFYREALALDPSNREAREMIELLVAQKSFRLEAGYFLEDFDFASNTNGTYTELSYTDQHRTTLLGRFSFQRKFGENAARVGAGLTRRLREHTYVRGEASFAPAVAVLARQDYEVEVTQVVRSRYGVGLAYRFLDFRAANVHVLTPLANIELRPDVHLYVRYAPARIRFSSSAQAVWNHSGWVRLVWDIDRTWSPYVVFAVGSESFSGLSAEQLGRFAAQTYGAGTTVHINERHGVRVGYFYQNRSQGRREHNLALAYTLRF